MGKSLQHSRFIYGVEIIVVIVIEHLSSMPNGDPKGISVAIMAVSMVMRTIGAALM